MKKLFFKGLVVCALAVFLLTGCQQKGTEQERSEKETVTSTEEAKEDEGNKQTQTIRIGALKGPTSMGLVKLLDESEQGKLGYAVEYRMETAADALAPMLMKSDLDFACIPANLASVLYNKSEGKICVLAVNTLGVLSIVDTKNEVHSIADLKGKTIYATGEGTTPEYVLRYLLAENGLDMDKDVTMDWRAESAEIVSLLAQAKEESIALLPQPFVTAAMSQVDGLKVQIDLNESWETLGVDKTMVTGVLVANRDFVTAQEELVQSFLKDYKASCEFASSAQSVDECANLVEKYDIVKAQIAQKALLNCHITYMDKEDMKQALSGYLQVLYDQNPQSVGGKLPEDDFYYMQ